ncbi:MAG: GNAT family N-acetyltransferase [Acidimicrobiales bacterium]|nr:GNAT family N-acetyltransferase [Acidimicrobiales bacterium]
MIVDSGLAARLEATLVADIAMFVRGVAATAPRTGARRIPVAGGWAAWTGLFGNRVQGAGLAGGTDPTDADPDHADPDHADPDHADPDHAEPHAGGIDDAERFYDGLDRRCEFELCPLADPQLTRSLAGRGYRLVGFRNVYAAAPEPRHPSVPGIDVHQVRGDDTSLDRWSTLILDGFGYRDAAARAAVDRWNRMLSAQPEAQLFLAVIEGRPAGAANLLIHGDTASLGGTTTLPAERRRGVQRALLDARLAAAHAAGCTLAVVTADPGSGSARNVERAGFQLAYTNVRLRRPVTAR